MCSNNGFQGSTPSLSVVVDHATVKGPVLTYTPSAEPPPGAAPEPLQRSRVAKALCRKKKSQLGIVSHTCSLGTWGAEAGGRIAVSLKPATE